MSELPDNWSLIRLGDDAQYKKGKKPKELVENYSDEFLPYIDIKAFEKKIIRQYAKKDSGTLAEDDDSLMVWDGARSGLVGNGIHGVIGSTLMRIRPIASNRGYFHYFLEFMYRVINSRTKGTGIPHVDPQVLWGLDYPVAPLNEQTRIANKIDSLLVKAQDTQTRLEKIPDILKRFRQSVLAAATSGELTKEWRDSEQEDSDWKELSLDELIESSMNGLSKRKGSEGQDVTILRLADFKNAVRVTGVERKILLTTKEVEKYQLFEGDILVVRVNGSVELAGKFIEHEGNRLEGFCDHFIRLRLKSDLIIPRYLTYVANEGKGRKYLKGRLSTSAGQNTINQQSVKGLVFPLPNILEQKEIVRQVESLFSLADKVEKQYEAAKQRTDRLTQSLLAKAFRGELVPQDPNDESASALLKRIQAEREALEKTKPKKKRPVTKITGKNVTKKKSMNKTRKSPEVEDKPYLASILKGSQSLNDAKTLFIFSDLTVQDFYKQLAWEIDQGFIKVNDELIEAA